MEDCLSGIYFTNPCIIDGQQQRRSWLADVTIQIALLFIRHLKLALADTPDLRTRVVRLLVHTRALCNGLLTLLDV